MRTIHRILQRHAFTQPRSRRYEAKGTRYPALAGTRVKRVHQSDFVGPCYLEGPTRFYSLHTVDLAPGRCGTESLIARGGQHTIDAFWAIWHRLGMPVHQQVDNDMIFYGSPAYPRGMGSLIRLCLQSDIERWFIPPGEPWRNGVIEKFNDQYRQKFLDRVHLAGPAALAEQAHHFEHRHNQTSRYSKLRGRTPMETLAMPRHPLRFPPPEPAPRYPLKKPETGQYHVVRFIRSDGLLNVFGEHCPVPPEALYEYVIATIVVEEQMLKLSLDQVPIDQIAYPLF